MGYNEFRFLEDMHRDLNMRLWQKKNTAFGNSESKEYKDVSDMVLKTLNEWESEHRKNFDMNLQAGSLSKTAIKHISKVLARPFKEKVFKSFVAATNKNCRDPRYDLYCKQFYPDEDVFFNDDGL